MKYAAIIDDRTFEIEIDRSGEITLDGRVYHVDLQSIDGVSLFSLLLDGRSYEVFVERRDGEYYVLLEGEMHVIRVEDERLRRLAKLEKKAPAPKGEVPIKAPMPGLVVAVPARVGEPVKMGEGVVILEAMKMENEIRAPRDGVVKAVRVAPGEAVNQGQVLAVIG
ncbi:MAG: biotin/lipoyl-containing protein [Anaerolineae bacterium]